MAVKDTIEYDNDIKSIAPAVAPTHCTNMINFNRFFQICVITHPHKPVYQCTTESQGYKMKKYRIEARFRYLIYGFHLVYHPT